MAYHPFRSASINRNRQACYDLISSNLVGQSLVDVIYEIVFLSASVKYDGVLFIHPICVTNSVKNFIGDERENPSKTLMSFAVDYTLEFEMRSDDLILNEVKKNGIGETIFVGELEDACQNGDWIKAEKILSKTFIASDRSRATFDTLVELALQNSPSSAVFIYHLLRGYQFQERKDDNWTFVNCAFEQVKFHGLGPVHSKTDFKPEIVKDLIKKSGDFVYFSAIENIWNGDYVRSRGYRRELSYWLSKIELSSNENSKIQLSDFLRIKNNKSYTTLAKEIVNDPAKTKNQKAKDLVILESIRSIKRKINNK